MTGQAHAQAEPAADDPAPAAPIAEPAPPAGVPSDDELRRDVRAQREETSALRSEVQALRDELARAREKKAEPAPSYRLSWSGYFHTDWVAVRQSSLEEVNPSTGEPLNEKRFVIPRARLTAKWERGPVFGVIEIDGNTVNGPILRPVIVNGGFRWYGANKEGPPLLMVSAGLLRTPFGFELVQTFRERLFIDQSEVVRALFPGIYDLGVVAGGGYSFLRYSLAAMNGAPLLERQFPGRDPTESKDLMGRVGVEAKASSTTRGRAGLSWMIGHGFHQGKPPSKDGARWADFNEDGQVDASEFTGVGGAAGEASQIFPRFAFGVDAGFTLRVPVLGETYAYGELIVAKNADRSLNTAADPVTSARALRELGYYLAVTQELTKYGMAGVRYEHYDPDRDASEQRVRLVPIDRSTRRWAFALAGRYAGSRLIVEYAHVTNALGREPSGAPARLRDDTVTVRLEVGFP